MAVVLLPNTYGDTISSTKHLRKQKYANFTTANSERLYITDAAQSGLDGFPHVTCWAWVKIVSQTGYNGVIAKYRSSGATPGGYLLSVDNGKAGMRAADAVTAGGKASTALIPVGTWTFIAGWYDGSNVFVSINAATPEKAAFVSAITSGPEDFEIGAVYSGTLWFTNGGIRCAGVSSSVLDPDEIKYLYNGGTPLHYGAVNHPGLKAKVIGYWNLNENSDGTGAVSRLDSVGVNDLTDVNTTPSVSIDAIHATPTGYDANHAYHGPRSAMHKLGYGYEQRILSTGTSVSVTHAVLTRADLFANSETPGELSLRYYDGSHKFSSTIQAENLNLVGIKNQDAVETMAETGSEFGVSYYPDKGNSALLHGPVYFSNSFTFGVEPSLDPTWASISNAGIEKVRPVHGYEWYDVEHSITLKWRKVSQAKIAAFKALPLHWPLFIYDDSGDLIQHKLEHVIIADPYTIDRVGLDLFDIEIIFKRLRHYE